MNRNKVIKKNENDMIKIFEEEIALKDNLIKAQEELIQGLKEKSDFLEESYEKLKAEMKELMEAYETVRELSENQQVIMDRLLNEAGLDELDCEESE